LNVAIPQDKHEDFGTSEVIKAVAALQHEGRLVFEGICCDWQIRCLDHLSFDSCIRHALSFQSTSHMSKLPPLYSPR